MLGKVVKDTISGWTGVAIQKNEYLNGCIQYAVQPKVLKDGKVIDSVRIDQEQLYVVKDYITPKPCLNKQSFEMSEEVKDKITGVKGRVIAKITYLDGTFRYGYQPKVKTRDAKIITHWQDSELLDSVRKMKVSTPKSSGGPAPFSLPAAKGE